VGARFEAFERIVDRHIRAQLDGLKRLLEAEG
jgi:hypothetical protein